MNKKGQFFLIAALIIAGIILSLATVQIYTKTSQSENIKIYDLSKEIDFESKQVIDNGIYTESSADSILQNISTLIDYYAKANPEKNITFIYGNEKSGLISWSYIVSYGQTGLSFGGTSSGLTSLKREIQENKVYSEGGKVSVTLKNNQLSFNLKPGENFYIILQETKEGEQLVAVR